MEIRVLKYFLAVAREGSITGAANSLHLTQPTLTRQLQELEKELRQKLLIRGKHKVTLTLEGMILRKRAEEIVDMVEKTKAEFLAISGTTGGNVYIGGGESDSIKHVAEINKEIRSDHPEVKFHIYSGNAEDVTEKVDKGLLDFGILIQPVDVSKYDHITLPEKDVWGVVMRKDSPLAKKKHVELSDLQNIPLLNSRQAIKKTFSKNEFIEWFQGNFDKLNTAVTFNLVYNAAVMVKAGIGYAVTLDKLVDTSEESELCFRPLKPKLESGLDIVWKKHRVFSPAAKLFLDKALEKFAPDTPADASGQTANANFAQRYISFIMHCRLHGRIVFLKRRRPQHENRKTTKERKIHNRNIGRSFNKKFPDPKSAESFCRNKKRAARTNRQLSLSGYLQTGEYNEMPFTLSCLTTAPFFTSSQNGSTIGFTEINFPLVKVTLVRILP